MDTKSRIKSLTKLFLCFASLWIIFEGVRLIPGSDVKAHSDVEYYQENSIVEESTEEETTLETEVTIANDKTLETEVATEKIEYVEPVEVPVITDIRIDTSIFKKSYSRGESVDVSGLIVKAQFSDGTETQLDINDYTVSTVDTNTCGIKEIEVQSENFIQTVEIEVVFTEEDVEDYKMYSSTSLNLRGGPGTEFEVLGSVSLNDEVTVLAKADNGWVKVLYNDKEYYCSASYLMNEPKVIVVEQTVSQDTSSYDSNLLIFDGNVSKECKDKAISLFNKIPQNIKDAVAADGSSWVVSASSSNTDGHCGTYYSKQWYPDRNPNICIYAKSVWAVDIAVIHEAGHWIDDYLGRKEGWGATSHYGYNGVTSDETWVDIFNEEVGASGYPSWANYCPEEYFAESVWKALAEPSWCKKTLPKTYEYVMNCINRVE